MTKKTTPPDAICQLAKQIAADLFTNVDGQHCDELWGHKDDDEDYIGGWTESQMADRIKAHLREAAVEIKEDGK